MVDVEEFYDAQVFQPLNNDTVINPIIENYEVEEKLSINEIIKSNKLCIGE